MADKTIGLGPLRETEEAETDAYFQHMERISQRRYIKLTERTRLSQSPDVR